VQLHGRKASFSGVVPPVGIGISFDRGRIFLERTEVSEAPPTPTVIERLRDLDWAGTKTNSELGALLGVPEDTVRKALQRNSEGFLLTKRGGTNYVARAATLRAVS
jgi:hypothetical protein